MCSDLGLPDAENGGLFMIDQVQAGQVQLEGRVHPDAAVALDACPVVGAQPGRAPARIHTGSAEHLLSTVQPLVWTTALPLNAGIEHYLETQGMPKSLRAILTATC